MKKKYILPIAGLFSLVAAGAAVLQSEATKKPSTTSAATHELDAKLLDFRATATEPMGWGIVLIEITIDAGGVTKTLNAQDTLTGSNSRVFEGYGYIDKNDLPLTRGKSYHIVYTANTGDTSGLMAGEEKVIHISPLP